MSAYQNMINAGYRDMADFERPRDVTIAGYPVHVIREYREWINSHGVPFTDIRAACGFAGTHSGGARSTLSGRTDRPYRGEWCTTCNPTRDIRGAGTAHSRH